MLTPNSYDLQAKVFDRMTGLEQRAASTLVLPDFTNPAIGALDWADEVELKLALATMVSEQAPKVGVYDRIAEAEGSMCLRSAAKSLADATWKAEHVLAS